MFESIVKKLKKLTNGVVMSVDPPLPVQKPMLVTSWPTIAATMSAAPPILTTMKSARMPRMLSAGRTPTRFSPPGTSA